MKNFLVSLTAILTLLSGFAQKDQKPSFTYQYSTTPKIHARAMIANETSIYIGTNEGDLFEVAFSGKQAVTLSFEKRPFKEFRDILVVDDKILVLSSGDTSAILTYNKVSRTIERTQIFNGIFLDGFSLSDGKIFAMGDPVDGIFSLYEADTSNLTFRSFKAPKAEIGEAAFAASGTSVWRKDQYNYFFTGGNASYMHYQADQGDWKKVELPYKTCPSCGPYTAYLGDEFWFLAGGDYTDSDNGQHSVFKSTDKGKTWEEVLKASTGYRSVVFGQNKKLFLAGTNGIDYSKNAGKNWRKINSGNYVSGTVYKNWAVFSGMSGKLVFYKL